MDGDLSIVVAPRVVLQLLDRRVPRVRAHPDTSAAKAATAVTRARNLDMMLSTCSKMMCQRLTRPIAARDTNGRAKSDDLRRGAAMPAPA